MTPKTGKRSDASILADIQRLRHLLERRKLTRVQGALADAQREIEALRAQLRGKAAEVIAPEPRPGG